MNIKYLLLGMTPLFALAQVHYAKVEPYSSVVLKSSVQGLVTKVNLKVEGMFITQAKLIEIDSKLDKTNLIHTQHSINLLSKMLKLNQDSEKSLSETFKRKRSYYKKLNTLSTASKVQKENAYSALSSAKIQYLGTKEKIINLDKQIADLTYKTVQLKDTISKKSLIINEKYVYKIMVNEGDYVAPGVALAKIYDARSAKLVLFLDHDELEGLDTKKVYLNDVKTKYKVNKVWKVADEKFITSYRTEIYIPTPSGSFSKLMKVEIK